MSHDAARLATAAEAWKGQAGVATLVGFDGFIDAIISVVDQRQSQDEYSRIATIADFGAAVSAAAGKSRNFELVVEQTKIGGNGPIMALAMAEAATPVTYVGAVAVDRGSKHVHPVFDRLKVLADKVHVAGPPAQTDALEFRDGKLMMGKLAPMSDVTWESLSTAVADDWQGVLANVAAMAMVNWTMTLDMTTIWLTLARKVLPQLAGPRRTIFVDLADPAKRTREDLRAALDALVELQAVADVVLGLNGSECAQVWEVLGGSWQGDAEDTEVAAAGAQAIQQALGLQVVMVHLVASAAAADAQEAVTCPGFACTEPKITTGAGDHFNAGFFAAYCQKMSLYDCCLIGGATSGYYVRTAVSPSRDLVAQFLQQPPADQ
jgi:sugar/nucleoside kinase (ribokinase family)